MPKMLTLAQIDQFRSDGYLAPIRIMSEEVAAEIRARLEDHERRSGGPLRGDLKHKSHLLFTWLADLVRKDTILDAIEDLYGPNILCWNTNFFIKEACNPAFVSWHQDFDLLGTGQAGRRNGLGCALGEQQGERGDGGDPRHAHYGPDSAP